MSVHALKLRMPVGEVETSYGAYLRAPSPSFRPIGRMAHPEDDRHALRVERPAPFYGLIALPGARGDRPGDPAGDDLRAHRGSCRASRRQSSVTGMTLAVLCLFCGLILDTVTRGRREMRRLLAFARARPASEVSHQPTPAELVRRRWQAHHRSVAGFRCWWMRTGSGPGLAGNTREDLADLKRAGAQIVLVSSGAVALGRRQLGLSRSARLEMKQAAAAAGQPLLMQSWVAAFAAHDVPVAQLPPDVRRH